MVVTCEHCGARYKLDTSRVPGRGARVTCPKCKHVFVVYKQEPASAPEAAAPPEPAPPAGEATAVSEPPVDVDSLDFRKVGLGTWKVRIKIGLVYDFSDLRTLRKYIAEGRVGPDDLLSPDGHDWVPLSEIPDLEAHFVRVYREAEAAMAAAEEESVADAPSDFGEDIPTNIVGMASLEQAAAAAAAGGGAAPAPAGLPEGSGSGGGAPDASPRFVDPFESLQQKRRRRPAPARSASPRPAPAAEKRSPLPLALGGAAVLAVAAWALWPGGDEAPPPSPPAARAPAPAPAKAKVSREAIIRELEANLPEVEPEPVEDQDPWLDEEDQLIPVKPKDLPPAPPPVATMGGSTAAAPAASSAQVARSTADDHAAVAADAVRRGAWDEAVVAWRKALAERPNRSDWRVELGHALYELGDLAGATAELEKAARAGDRRADKWLGRIAQDRGDTDGAVAHYRRYLDSYPQDAAVRSAVDALRGG